MKKCLILITVVCLNTVLSINSKSLAADANLSAVTSSPSTSKGEIEASNPIKLHVVENAPSSDLPELTGPLGLSDAVQTGIKNNFSLRQSEQLWIASKFLARSALAKFGPSASFHTWYSASSLNQMLFDPYNTTINPETMQPVVKGSSLSLLFVGTQPIFTGGKLLGGYKAARAREHQLLDSYQEDRIATALKVKEAYWNAAWTEANLQVNSDYVRSQEWSSRNMKERLIEGKVPKADYLREEAELAKARIQLNENYRNYNSALLNLKVVMSVNIGSQINLKDALEYIETLGDVSKYLLSAAQNRPELDKATNKVLEAKANKLVAKSKYAPEVGLYGLSSNITGSSPDGNANGKWGGLIGVMGGITLFDSGSRFNELRAANAAVRQAELEKHDIELKVAQEVSQAWIDLDLARRNVELAKKEVTSAQEDQRLFHSRYQVGKAIALEDFDATIKLFQARLAVLEAIYNYRIAEARLQRASGRI